MPTKVVATNNAEHYKWGGATGADCDGWHLVNRDNLSVGPGQAHQAINRSGAPVRMLVTSQPPSHDDRTPA